MKDKYSKERIAMLSPYRNVRQVFTDFIEECENTFGVTLRIMMPVFRSTEEQNALYKQSRDGSGRPHVTDAKGGTSYHNYGLAVDLCEMSQDDKAIDWNYDMSKLDSIAKKHGLEWGGDWHSIKDRPHFELRMEFAENCSDLAKLPKDSNGYAII